MMFPREIFKIACPAFMRAVFSNFLRNIEIALGKKFRLPREQIRLNESSSMVTSFLFYF